MRKVKIRFNLGRGKNYLKWKVDTPIDDKRFVTNYYDPNEWQLVLSNCVFKNNRTTANKIFEGANKTVCAWVLCDNVNIIQVKGVQGKLRTNGLNQITYNPRKQPYWVLNETNVDNTQINLVISNNRSLFVVK